MHSKPTEKSGRLLKTQPNHGAGHITKLADLTPGTRFTNNHSNKIKTVVRIKSGRVIFKEGTRISSLDAADFGVISYPAGWNPTNFLKKA